MEGNGVENRGEDEIKVTQLARKPCSSSVRSIVKFALRRDGILGTSGNADRVMLINASAHRGEEYFFRVTFHLLKPSEIIVQARCSDNEYFRAIKCRWKCMKII